MHSLKREILLTQLLSYGRLSLEPLQRQGETLGGYETQHAALTANCAIDSPRQRV